MISINRLFAALALAAVAFAAPAAGAQISALPDRVSPPIPLGNTHPVLVAQFADTIYSATLSVEVDAQGRADLRTLTMSGSAAEYNRKAITDWLRGTTFRPAKKNGIPTRGTFRVTLETLKQAAADSI